MIISIIFSTTLKTSVYSTTLTPYLHDSQALVGYVHSYLLCLSRNLNFISRLCTGYKVFCFLEFMNIKDLGWNIGQSSKVCQGSLVFLKWAFRLNYVFKKCAVCIRFSILVRGHWATLKSLIDEQTGINKQSWKKVSPCSLSYKIDL